jgi:phosphorylated CTD-interacting factor 1
MAGVARQGANGPPKKWRGYVFKKDASLKRQASKQISVLCIAMADGESIKKRKRANLRQELHTVTLAPATGKGNTAAKGHKVQTGKRAKIWNSEVRTVRPPNLTKLGYAPHDPAVEDFRHACVAKSRAKLQALCARENLVAPLMAWERWQSSSKLAEQLACIKQKGGKLADFILPENPNEVDQGLVDDLVRASMEPLVARNVVIELTKASAQLVAEITTLEKNGGKGKGKAKGTGKAKGGRNAQTAVAVVEHKHTFDVSLGKQSKTKKLLKLNTQHYNKLRELFKRHVPTPPQQEGEAAAEIDEQKFSACLFNMLSRYNALLGHGMQCALSEHGFDALKGALDVTFECFASPLNCMYDVYCSAFPDTDCHFGSVGSFFDFFPTEGSFEANPPFIRPIMAAMVRHIEQLLAAPAAKALSFVVIVPGWTEMVAWALLQESKFKQLEMLVAAADHGYCSGAQHQRKDRYLEAPYDTAVFVLQNKQGAKRWPVPVGFVDLLQEAMAQATPTDAMKERRRSEGRGFGDADGGGGVYKGKKRNKSGEGVVQRKGEEEVKVNESAAKTSAVEVPPPSQAQRKKNKNKNKNKKNNQQPQQSQQPLAQQSPVQTTQVAATKIKIKKVNNTSR